MIDIEAELDRIVLYLINHCPDFRSMGVRLQGSKRWVKFSVN